MMFSFSQSTKVFLYGKPCDMRKGFNGLYGLVQNQMQMNPLFGYLFVFISSDRNKIKILHWEQDGLVLYYKRLEKAHSNDLRLKLMLLIVNLAKGNYS